jgi:hypothetical protein
MTSAADHGWLMTAEQPETNGLSLRRRSGALANDGNGAVPPYRGFRLQRQLGADSGRSRDRDEPPGSTYFRHFA